MKIYLGRISIEDQSEIVETVRLTVEGNNYEIEFASNDHFYKDFRVICGVFNGLGNLTFIDCRNVSSETGSGANIRRYKPKYTLINVQLENPYDFYYDSATITMPGLLGWTGLHSVDLKKNGDFNANILLKKLDDVLIFTGDSFSISIYASNSFSFKRESNERVIQEYVGFKVLRLGSNKMDIWRFLKIFKELQKILLIIGNKKTDVTSINFHKCNQHPVIFKSNEITSLGEVSTFGPAFKFQDIKNNLQSIFENWFNNSEIHTSINLILEKAAYSLSRENFFLNNCFAIETFHRRFRNYPLFDKSTFRAFKKKLLSNIEKDEGEMSKLVENNLAHLNEPNFRSRLLDFKNEFEVILEGVCDPDLFIKKIVKTRNYLVHRSSSDHIFDSYDMLYASFLIELITKYSIYKTLTIEENICDEVLKKISERIRESYSINKKMRNEI